jgi:hypothetical protein
MLEMHSTDDHALRLEYLCATPYLPSSQKNLLTLARQASQLPVFASIIHHIRLRRGASPLQASSEDGLLPQNRVLQSSPQLPILLLWNEEAPGSSAERTMLEEFAVLADGKIRLLGPYPNDGTPDTGLTNEAGAHLLANMLASPSLALVTGDQLPQSIPIVHISAHSSVDSPSSREFSKIVLARKASNSKHWWQRSTAEPSSVGPFTITNGILDALWLGGSQISDGPLGVLSSCESSALSSLGSLSIAGCLLRFGYRAVIGTETTIPGDVAHDFLRVFYQRLLIRGETVGRALLSARLAGLNSEKPNPLGCLFTLHGDPYLSLSNKERP